MKVGKGRSSLGLALEETSRQHPGRRKEKGRPCLGVEERTHGSEKTNTAEGRRGHSCLQDVCSADLISQLLRFGKEK